MKERVRAALRERGTAPVHASQLEWDIIRVWWSTTRSPKYAE